MLRRIYTILLTGFLACSGKSSNDVISEQKENMEKDVVCFVYHRFGDNRYPSTNISVNDFEQHLQYLIKEDFQLLNLSDAIKYLSSDEPARKTAVITIDDGYKSFYENGMPLLKQYNVPATLFINTSTVGGGDYMNWSQLKEAIEASVEIGNHTNTHAYFLNEDKTTRYKTFENEITESQEIIKKNLQVTPAVFAYPYGEFDLEMKKIVQQKDFAGAAAQNSGVLYEQTDLFGIPRFSMSESYAALKNFREKVETRPLRLAKQNTTTNVLTTDNLQPELTITFEQNDLQIDRLQCFVQGSNCEMKITKTDSLVTLSLKSKTDLTSRRRTLYTITVPDKTGVWHWHSHLWINPQVK